MKVKLKTAYTAACQIPGWDFFDEKRGLACLDNSVNRSAKHIHQLEIARRMKVKTVISQLRSCGAALEWYDEDHEMWRELLINQLVNDSMKVRIAPESWFAKQKVLEYFGLSAAKKYIRWISGKRKYRFIFHGKETKLLKSNHEKLHCAFSYFMSLEQSGIHIYVKKSN